MWTTPAATEMRFGFEVTTEKPKQKLICNLCNEPIPYAVAKFCWFNKPKFGGNLYCIECQKKV